ncbi:NAD(P)-dependent oxidoreductase [Oxyplasma meridianum]|uniref:NAD(P)-dependent oxidoreductase n=1 Tax=Oxyplasma meridianum TaxID=3073602 RepID=A0AAX4NI45_9ARCH
MTSDIGFIGLGKMGRPILYNILKKYKVTGIYNRTKQKADEFGALGLKVFQYPFQVSSNCNIIFVIVTDSQASQEIISGKNGLLSHIIPGTIIVDMSTISLKASNENRANVMEKSCTYVDCPVIGSVSFAQNAELTALFGGEKKAFDTVKPFLEAFSKNIFYMGDGGNGIKMKLIHNMLLGENLAALSEALVFGDRLGMNREQMLDILSVSSAGSTVLGIKREPLLKEDFIPAFLLNHEIKDINYALEMAKDSRISLPLGGLTSQMYASASSIGYGNLDMSAVIKAFKRINGEK